MTKTVNYLILLKLNEILNYLQYFALFDWELRSEQILDLQNS